jgi:hypothetical protein
MPCKHLRLFPNVFQSLIVISLIGPELIGKFIDPMLNSTVAIIKLAFFCFDDKGVVKVKQGCASTSCESWLVNTQAVFGQFFDTEHWYISLSIARTACAHFYFKSSCRPLGGKFSGKYKWRR